MKKIEMLEKVELNKVRVALKNFQNYIMQADPADSRLSTLKEIQVKVQSCLEGKNVLPVEELKNIQESLREDMKNQGDFKSALEIVDHQMKERKMSEGSNINDKPEETKTTQEVKVSKPLPAVPATRAPVTSAQRVPVPPLSEANFEKEPIRRARGDMISRGQPLTAAKLVSSNQNSELGVLGRRLINQSQQQQGDPQKSNLMHAFEELGKMNISQTASEAIDEAKKILGQGKSAREVVEKFLSFMEPKTVSKIGINRTYISSDEKSILKDFLNTKGMKEAINSDPVTRSVLKKAATQIGSAGRVIIESALPKVEKTVAPKK